MQSRRSDVAPVSLRFGSVTAIAIVSLVFAAGCEGCMDTETSGGADGGDVAEADMGAEGPSNSFDENFEDWTAVDLESYVDAKPDYSEVLTELDDLEWKESGGQSGGYLSRTDTTGEAFFFEAPSSYTGDLSDYKGGRVTFYLQSTHDNWDSDNVFVLVGGNGDVIVSTLSTPGEDWTEYTVELTADNFLYDYKDGDPVSEADFDAVLQDVAAFRISGEWGAQVEETVGFDTVRLHSGN